MKQAIQLKEPKTGNNLYPSPYYPIGSIYISASSVNPSTFFGGTWTQIKDCFLLCAGTKYNAGTTGGEAEHQLTTNEMPSHNHSASTNYTGNHNHGYESQKKRYADKVMSGAGSVLAANTAYNYATYYYTDGNGGHSHSVSVGNNGGNAKHNNMPPYLAVFVWRRDK